MDGYNLLAAFGVYKSHIGVISGVLLWTLLGVMTSFTSFTIYVWLTQSKTVAGSLMLFIVGGAFGFLYPIIREIPAACVAGWNEGTARLESL